mmetsp:Transcript_9783/g.17230  ORF Transcript_9783/g.17230 Transcript_9783/m.17230 type:complete len:80 (-) Transcript_9783:1211-1450(-)
MRYTLVRGTHPIKTPTRDIHSQSILYTTAVQQCSRHHPTYKPKKERLLTCLVLNLLLRNPQFREYGTEFRRPLGLFPLR